VCQYMQDIGKRCRRISHKWLNYKLETKGGLEIIVFSHGV